MAEKSCWALIKEAEGDDPIVRRIREMYQYLEEQYEALDYPMTLVAIAAQDKLVELFPWLGGTADE